MSCPGKCNCGSIGFELGMSDANLGAEFGGEVADFGSQSEDMEAIDRFIKDSLPVNDKAKRIKAAWVNWYNDLSWYAKNLDGNTYNIARNKRNEYTLANVKSTQEKQKVQQVILTGLTTEQQQGGANPRLPDGSFPVAKKPLIPTEYKVGAIVLGSVAVIAMAYAIPGAIAKKASPL